MFSQALLDAATQLVRSYSSMNLKLVSAESCTGGLVASLVTSVAGSSAVFERGFVTYSNRAKQEMLGIDASEIESHGAVSERIARLMAEGAIQKSGADIAVSVTGIAGPDGGSETKPVGTVHIAVAIKGRETCHERCHFVGERDHVRMQTVGKVLQMLLPIES